MNNDISNKFSIKVSNRLSLFLLMEARQKKKILEALISKSYDIVFFCSEIPIIK